MNNAEWGFFKAQPIGLELFSPWALLARRLHRMTISHSFRFAQRKNTCQQRSKWNVNRPLC